MSEEIRNSTKIPELLNAVQDVYGITIPDVSTESPLSEIWNMPIAVTEGSPPEPDFTATGSISDTFPFDFVQVISPPPSVDANLKITVFESAPPEINPRGIKSTVFPVPISPVHPNGVIVKNGLTFIDQAGVSVPAESVVPIEAQS